MAKTANKIKSAAPEFPVPQTLDEVNHAIDRIGECQRDVQRLETEMNEKLAQIKSEYSLRAQPFGEEIKSLAAGVQMYCDAHRKELTNDLKVKFARLASGEVNWRLGNPTVKLKKGVSEETIISLLKSMQRGEFVRKREEIDKETILSCDEVRTALAELAFIPGKPKVVEVAGLKELTVVQVENFGIKPHASELEVAV